MHNVLVIGVGSIGERHLRCFQTTGRAALTFVEVNESLRKTISERYGVTGFADLDSAIAHSQQAAQSTTRTAVVATPAHLHIEMADRLVEDGFHVLIEKPLSTRMDGIESLQKKVVDRKSTAAVAYVLRCHPVLVAFKKALDTGDLGRPVQLVATSGQHFPTYRPAYRTIYYTRRVTGGGAIQDALTHLINAGEWLVGPVTRLVADAAHQVLPGVEVEDTAHVLARHGSVLASYTLNQYQAPNESTVTVVCERGTLRYEAHENRWRWQTEPGGTWHSESFPPMERDTIFVAQANRFLDCVERAIVPPCTIAEGLQTLRVNLAALASADGGGWQDLAGCDGLARG